MKKKFVIFYSIFIFIIYLVSLFNFGFTVYKEYVNSMSDPLYIFSTEKILTSLEKSFFIILFATILTIIILIFSYKSFSSKKINSTEDIIDEDLKETENDLDIEEIEMNQTGEINNSEIAEQQSISEQSEENNEEDTFENNEMINDYEENTENVLENSSNSEDYTNQTNISLPSEEIKPIQSDVHIFSPKTGFCFESYLEPRLDNEINRAIASEFDLALFVLKIPSIQLEENSKILQNVCKYLTTEFQFKDLLFEYSEDCLIGIKNNINLDDSLTFADKLYFDLSEIIKENHLECYIGISTRTVRIITGKRLLTEATEALRHAEKEENNPIIAFRANAEKYRKMMQE